MAYHIALNRPTDLQSIAAKARDGLNPRHSMAALAEELRAVVHDGAGLVPSAADRAIGAITRTRPLWWTIARQLRRQVVPGDVIFCTGEDIGISVATLCGTLTDVKVAVMVHYVDRLKGRLAFRLFGMRRKVAMFYAVADPQVTFLADFLRLPPDRVSFVWDQTDTEFFAPSPSLPAPKSRPMIMSVGLEKRDYRSLAQATGAMDIDVKISGYSADTRVLTHALPEEMPANFSRRFYSWVELLELYRSADIVVVSLYPNRHAAGVQAMMEALACGRPVLVTATEGLQKYLDRSEALRIVPTGNPEAMRAAIVDLLARPDERKRLGERAAQLARERYPLENYVHALARGLRALAT